EVTVWTGVNSSGKSTLLGQVMLAAVEQRFPVCAYSGELPDRIFRYWIDLQAAGPSWVREEWREDRKASVYRPDPECIKAIRSWYRDYFFLYDTKCVASEENLLEVFTYAVQRYGCRVFTVDNLMTTVTSGTERDYFRKQSEFIGRMVEFAHQYDVHVHIVAHPRKTQGSAPITKMDVAGSGDITNRADNVLALHRCTRKEKLEDGANRCEAKLKVFKNRFGGRQDIEVQLDFDFKSKRFFLPSDPQGPNWVYSWVYETGEAKRQLKEWESLGTVVSSGLFS
ncbi:MAG: hypothetical protein GXX09_02505, partial [Syntrophomonadaceae bacterium]|nr:hypothetical protein [Syntrophomonadaceae bacterium]